MTRAARRTLAAGFATAMALAAIFPVYQGNAWFARTLGAILAVTLAGLVCRAVRLPGARQPIVGLLVLCGYLLVAFAHGTFAHGLPTAATFDELRRLVEAGQADIDKYGPPVPVSPGLVLLTAAGVGAVALLVDILAVVLDRVAVAGLPLLVLFAVPSAVLPGGLGGTAFAVGAVGWLVLLLEEGSERVSRWGTPMRSGSQRTVGEESSLGRVGRRIGACALGLAVVVPSLVPGLDHRLISGSGGVGPGGEGPSQSTTYNPLTTLQTQLTLPQPRQLFVYTTDDPQPDYVRMTTLDTYTGSGWSSSKLEADRDEARVQKGIDAPAGEDPSAQHQDVRMRVAVDGDHLEVHWLPLPYGPRQVDVDGTWLWDRDSQTVFSASRTTKRLAPYTVRAQRVLPTRDALLAATGQEIDGDIAAHYGEGLQVPYEVAALAQRITRTANTPYDRAVAIQRFFTNPNSGFVYDTNPSLPGAGEDALQAFLEGKHGFCEQYATAMAVLLRVVGVPSRVAVGFTPGQRVSDKGGKTATATDTATDTATYSVTTSDAHAWPEAWFSGTGWVRFEPTPAASGASIPDYTLTPKPGVGPTDTPSDGPTPTAKPSALPRGFQDPDDLLRNQGGAAAATASQRHVGRWVLLGVLAALVLCAPFALTALRRRARVARLDPLVAWEQLRDDVCDVGGPWDPTDSPAAAARRLADLLDTPGARVAPAREALGRLATAAELTRYAPPGRAAELQAGRAADLRADLTAVRRGLQASAPRTVRWRAVVLAPSTLRWAAHRTAERVADVLDLTDRVVSAVFRPARRLLRVRA
jgi:transglutaminase-like putative cysteine protease